MKPKPMLFDEPTSALEPELVVEMLEVMTSLAAVKMPMIVVTQETGFAPEVADGVVFMADGTVIATGPPDELLSAPRHELTRQYLARIL
jgi:polar amino acid transport system ATP-binding protein